MEIKSRKEYEKMKKEYKESLEKKLRDLAKKIVEEMPEITAEEFMALIDGKEIIRMIKMKGVPAESHKYFVQLIENGFKETFTTYIKTVDLAETSMKLSFKKDDATATHRGGGGEKCTA